MTSTQTDFDAAKAIFEQLNGVDKDRQRRILRWVSESLGIEVGPTGPVASPPPAPPPEAPQPPAPGLPAADIKSFVEQKQPKSDVQFATVAAYFYRFEASGEAQSNTITSTMLRHATRLAGWNRLPSPSVTLNNAKKQGYFDTSSRGQFAVNSVGENLVAMTLPGSGDATLPRSTQTKPTRKRKTKAVKKKVAKKKKKSKKRKRAKAS